MLIIDIFHDIHIITNLLLLLMFQFFVGVGVGIYLGTEYDFKPYIKFVKGAIKKIEKRTDNDSDSSNDKQKSSNGWFFGSSKKDK